MVLNIRRPWHDGTSAILFEPHELIARLCSIVPKRRINLLLYHGVLGPNARLRCAAVGAAQATASCAPQVAGSHAGNPGLEG
ncbi:MAG TPA: hypothetical protein VEI94_09805, partial [Candidatus Bathyarchaeia archaeon]|nr:hypothetical protein [Candidatus Bathyarchaeia archaeon]